MTPHTLPPGIHQVTARGRRYVYYQPHRGTAAQGPRIRLPAIGLPEFWLALREAQTLYSARQYDMTIGNEWLTEARPAAGSAEDRRSPAGHQEPFPEA